jgi:hypothetical protein
MIPKIVGPNQVSDGWRIACKIGDPGSHGKIPTEKAVRDALRSIYYGAVDESVFFFEGDNPPPFFDIDNYDFHDSAGFEAGVDQDVIFRIDPRDFSNGVHINLLYCMSTSSPGQLRFRIDYRVKSIGEDVTGGMNYHSLLTLDPVDQLHVMQSIELTNISAGKLTNAELVHCRLTRLGSDPLDTHDGVFCLIGIRISSL